MTSKPISKTFASNVHVIKAEFFKPSILKIRSLIEYMHRPLLIQKLTSFHEQNFSFRFFFPNSVIKFKRNNHQF